MKVPNKNVLITYAAIGVGGFFIVRYFLPWLAEQAGKTLKDIITKSSSGAGSAVAGAITAAPVAISSIVRNVNQWALSDDNLLKPIGDTVGSWIYDVTHNKWLQNSSASTALEKAAQAELLARKNAGIRTSR